MLNGKIMADNNAVDVWLKCLICKFKPPPFLKYFTDD